MRRESSTGSGSSLVRPAGLGVEGCQVRPSVWARAVKPNRRGVLVARPAPAIDAMPRHPLCQVARRLGAEGSACALSERARRRRLSRTVPRLGFTSLTIATSGSAVVALRQRAQSIAGNQRATSGSLLIGWLPRRWRERVLRAGSRSSQPARGGPSRRRRSEGAGGVGIPHERRIVPVERIAAGRCCRRRSSCRTPRSRVLVIAGRSNACNIAH